MLRGVDFINLDNTADDAIDADQLTWFDALHIDQSELVQAIAAYQTASFMFKHGLMKDVAYPASARPSAIDHR